MKKKAILWILFFIASVALADIISSHIFKPNFNRLRPCQIGSGIEQLMTLRLSNCPGNGSFTSSHAANHFAMAFFMVFSMRGISKRWKWSMIMLLWATIICWAQIYVGVHYPGDILGGAILAFVIAYLLNKIYLNLHFKIFSKKIEHGKENT